MRFPNITSAAWRRRKLGKLAYYGAGVMRDALPGFILRRRLEPFYRKLDKTGISDDMRSRIDYYHQINGPISLDGARTMRDMPFDQTYYYYDFRRISKYFGDDIRANWEFGDVTLVPDRPTLLKSRPIAGDIANSLVMKLESFRHFQWSNDPVAFADKQPRAVWRGDLNNPLRRALVARYNDDPHHDIGHTRRSGETVPPKAFVSAQAQLGFRYIISIEGNDVATNLKWVMSSGSLCLMPKPKYETWYMEGRLEPGVHYVALRDDFADLDEKIDHYEANPNEARAIVAAANAYTQTFRNAADELTLSLLVMQKYLELSGQIPARYFA